MTFRRLRHFFRRPATSAATFSPTGAMDGTRWLVCDTTACAHLTTRHTPVPACCDQAGTGPAPTTWQCTRCGTTKGDQ
ncbi:hypothetical protein ABWK57_02645 [Streptomyces sp. NPDC094045]|uniref:hypothetical protein n=2 Tax=unclassified Streptomyces TaxID=2593676 RepID=UPI00339A3C65